MIKRKKTSKLPKHLGGHANVTHIDEASLNWMINDFQIKSFVDVGCGPGGMVYLAHQKGLEALGIDGDYTLIRKKPELFITHDYTKGPLHLTHTYDLCWSCAFTEHVDAKYTDNFMQTMHGAKYIIVTYATPGTKGRHHVNCQHEDYWLRKFAQHDFLHVPELTEHLRAITTLDRDFIKNHGLFFVNTRYLDDIPSKLKTMVTEITNSYKFIVQS